MEKSFMGAALRSYAKRLRSDFSLIGLIRALCPVNIDQIQSSSCLIVSFYMQGTVITRWSRFANTLPNTKQSRIEMH